jgi:hypothetical protein
MASASVLQAWERAFKSGSKSLQQKLRAAHGNKPEFKKFLKDQGLETETSVKQVSKSQVDKVKQKAREKLAAKAYGATKGTRMGAADGSGETLRDTIAPLSPEQHAAVKTAERTAKAAAKPAAKPKKEKKSKAPKPEESRLDMIKRLASRKKINNPPVSAKQLRTIAAVGGQEHDHGGFDDLSGTGYEHLGGRHSMDEMNKEMPLSREQLDNMAKQKSAEYAKLYDKVSPEMRKKLKLPAKLPEEVKDKVKAKTPASSPLHVTLDQAYAKGRFGRAPRGSKTLKNMSDIKLANNLTREETEFKVGDKVSIHSPDDWDWHERKGELVSTSNDGHVVKLNDGGMLSVAKHQIKKIDEEMNNRITKIHVRGQNVIVHKYDTEANGTYKEVKHHSSATAAQTYARQLHKARGRNAKLVINENIIDRFVANKIAAYHSNKVKGSVEQSDAAREAVTKKMEPIKKKIERIKARASYKDKSHARHDETKLDLKHANDEHAALKAERAKHYDAFKNASAERDSNIASDMKTYDKYGLVGLGLKRLKQNIQKEETMNEGILSTILGKKKELAKPTPKKTGYQGLPAEWSQEKRGNEYDANKYMAKLKNEEYKEPFEGGKEPSKNKGIVVGKSRPEGMSRVAHLARQALKKKAAMKEGYMKANMPETEDDNGASDMAEYERQAKKKGVRAYDKKGNLVGNYRSMADAKKFKPNHTYKEEAKPSSVYALNPGMKEKLWAKHMADKKASSQAPADRAARMKDRIAAAKSK